MYHLYAQALRHGLILFHTDPENKPAGDTGGGGGGAGRKADKPVSEVVASLIRRHGGAETALGVLAGENRDYRRRHRDDQARIQELQGKMGDGAVVLSKDEAAQWEAYKALGKPDEIKPKLEKVPELERKVTERERKDLLTEAGKAVNWNPDAFNELVTAKGLHVEMRDVKVKDAKGEEVTVKQPHVRLAANESDPLVPAPTWVEQNAKVWEPSLKAGAATGQQPAGGSTGLPVPGVQARSTNGTSPTGTDPVAAAMAANAARAAAPNPLRPAPATTTQGS